MLKGNAKQFCNGRHQDNFREIGNLCMHYAVTKFTLLSVNLQNQMEPTTMGLKCKRKKDCMRKIDMQKIGVA